MPNWCDNRLAIAGPPNVVMELVRLLEGPEEKLDFERLLPTPDDLHAGAGYRVPGDGDPLPDWYEWRCEHWGVKWSARDVKRRGFGRTGRVRYRFFTPYGAPHEFLDHVAELAPEIAMWLSYDVELLGYGHAVWRDGRQVEYEEQTAYGGSVHRDT